MNVAITKTKNASLRWLCFAAFSFTLTFPGSVFAGPDGYGKNYGKNGFGKTSLFETSSDEGRPSRHRFGVQGTGFLGIDGHILSDGFLKAGVAVPSEALSSSESDDFSAGGEVFYEYLLSDPGSPNLFGLRAGLGYTRLEFGHDFSVTDEFGETLSMSHDFEADLFSLNVGPFYERRFTNRLFAQFGAGLSVAYIRGRYDSRDGAGFFQDTEKDDNVLFGAYASAALGFDFTPSMSLLGGVRYQYLESFSLRGAAGQVDLDFDHAYQVFLGLRWQF